MADPTFGYQVDAETNEVRPQLGYSSAPRRLWTSYEEIAFDSGVAFAIAKLIKRLERQLCFDALADDDGRCPHHGGKCYDLRQLIIGLQEGKIDG